jgi:hypothetical protein
MSDADTQAADVQKFLDDVKNSRREFNLSVGPALDKMMQMADGESGTLSKISREARAAASDFLDELDHLSAALD